MKPLAEATLEEITVRAVITRADGSVEDRGVIRHWEKGKTPAPGGVVAMLMNFLKKDN